MFAFSPRCSDFIQGYSKTDSCFFCICDDLEVKGKQLFTGPTQPGCRAVRADLGSQLAKEFCWTQIISSNKVTHGL